MTYVFVGHDLRLVRHLCHDVAVMYRGKIVEAGPATTVLGRAAHPYTAALATASSLAVLAATDDADTQVTPSDDGVGCPYRFRCPHADNVCAEITPEPSDPGDGRSVRCHHPLITASTPW